MAKYLLVESRDPFENRESEKFLEMAGNLADSGDHISLFLVQNGVFASRKSSAFTATMKELLKRNVQIYADSFSIDERAIQEHERLDQITLSGMEEFLEILFAPGTKTIWHS